MQTLPEWLTWAVGGGAGALTWALVALLRKWDPFVKQWDKLLPEVRRIAVFAFASLLGLGAFWAQVQFGYIPSPGDLTAWFEAAFSIVVSQVIYAGAKLITRKRA